MTNTRSSAIRRMSDVNTATLESGELAGAVHLPYRFMAIKWQTRRLRA